MELIDSIPTVDDAPASAYEQVVWERDLAIKQLNDIGKGLGEKMDDVAKVVRCKDCIHWCATVTYSTLCDHYDTPDAFCSYGKRRTDDSP